MSPYSLCVVVGLACVVTLAAYMARVYSEFGKILSRQVQDNLDAWEQHVEPRLGMTRERGEHGRGEGTSPLQTVRRSAGATSPTK